MNRQIKEKLENLDTLSGGVVFSKGEAWERLQARMDKKPTKKIALKFWMAAAAAILFLFICITVMYYSPEEETIANTPVRTEEQQTISTVEMPQPQAPTKTIQPDIKVAVEKKSSKHITPHLIKENKQELIQETPGAPVEEIKVVEAVIAPSPVTPVKKQMRVVHISNLDKEDAEVAPVIVNAGHADMSKMKVVTISDIAKGDRATNTDKVERPNKPIQFLTPPYRTASEPANIRIAQNPLQLKFNVQN